MPKLIGVIGDRGDGKTLLMTYLLYQDWLKGYNIVSNYHLYFPKDNNRERPVYLTYNEIIEIPDTLKQASVGLDEIQMGADSRRGLAKGNLLITKLVTQMRKRDLDIYYSTQRLKMVDKRVRDQTDYFIIMQRYPCFDDETGKKGAKWFRYQVLDAEFLDVINEGDNSGWRYFKATKKMYELYDTNEIIEFGDDQE